MSTLIERLADDVADLLAGGGSGAPTNATYVVLSVNGTLTSERVLTAGSGISITDAGAGSTVTIAATGGGLSDGDKGDVTVSSSGTVWTIDNGVVSTAKMGGDVTVAGKALLDDADAAAQRTTLGLGTAALSSTAAFEAAGAIATHNAVTAGAHGMSAVGAGLVAQVFASDMRTDLGLGNSATLNVGTTAGTVCAGDDARLSGGSGLTQPQVLARGLGS